MWCEIFVKKLYFLSLVVANVNIEQCFSFLDRRKYRESYISGQNLEEKYIEDRERLIGGSTKQSNWAILY